MEQTRGFGVEVKTPLFIYPKLSIGVFSSRDIIVYISGGFI